MVSKLKINRKTLITFAKKCYESFNSASIKIEALQIVADTASMEFGDFFNPEILENPDEISINFIELLDQLIFELDENNSREDNIKEYIIDDLYLRISIYLDISMGEDVYINSFLDRVISYDDTVIIKKYHLKQFIPKLVSEFLETTLLRKDILRTLITFDDDFLLNFYYKLIKDLYCIEIKTLALVGLKNYGSKFTKWNSLKEANEDIIFLIDYVEDFNCNDLSDNKIPYNFYSIYFIMNLVELNTDLLKSEDAIKWLCKIDDNIFDIDITNSFFSNIFTSITNIVISFDLHLLEGLLEIEKYFLLFIEILDKLPRLYFNRISVKLEYYGEPFLKKIESSLNNEKLNLKESESNIHFYLLWKSV